MHQYLQGASWPHILLIVAAIYCAVMAVRSRRLIHSAVWLASVSALLAIVFYLFDAAFVAVIELSVGAGLVTVLFIFAISVAGEEAIDAKSLLPKPLAWLLVGVSFIFLAWFALPQSRVEIPISESNLSITLWEQRGLDVIVQVVLIFAGVLGLLGLLAETKPPLGEAMADEFAAIREKDLSLLERQSTSRAERTILPIKRDDHSEDSR